MKKSSEVQGLPIISIADGIEIGQAKSLIINPEKRSIDFITIGHEEWEPEGKAVPFNKIIGIGDYALTIDHESSVIEMNNIPVANELLNRNIKIIHARVMSKKGQLIGEASEYMIDDETGEIIQLVIKDTDGTFAVNGQYIVTYGRDLIIVSEDVMKEAIDGSEPYAAPIEPAEMPLAEKKQEASGQAEQPDEQADDQREEAQSSSSIDRWLQMIDEQQSQMLSGKVTTKNIEFNEEVLIPEGTVLDESHIQKAREAGPEVLVELSMNTGA